MPSIKTVDFVTFPLSAGGSVSSISPGLWGYPAQKSALLRPALLSSHPDGKGSQLRPVECLLALTSGRLGAPPPKRFVSVTEKTLSGLNLRVAPWMTDRKVGGSRQREFR